MRHLITRHSEPLARELLAAGPALIIEGARQVGKSTLAGQLVAGTAARSVTLDDERTRAAAREDPPGFVAQAASETLVIDELQRLPELTLAVKAAIDRDRSPGRFILTGSASTLRVRGLADSLAGRAFRMRLFGLSRGELADHNDDFASRVVNSVVDIPAFGSPLRRGDYADLIAAGGYPEIQGLSPALRGRWLDSYLDGVLRRDLVELRREVSPARANSLLRILAGQQSAELVRSRLADVSGVPAATITGYLDLLSDVGLIATIPPWTPNLTAREVGRRKSIVIDSALALRLARLTSAQLASFDYGDALGSFLEAFVSSELIRQQTWTAEEFELFHYRDRAGAEIDLVLEFSGGRVLGIEVKASSSFRSEDFRHLRMMRDRLGDRFIAGVVLNTGAEGSRFGDRLYCLPVSALWAW